jgi:hypothetical protein
VTLPALPFGQRHVLFAAAADRRPTASRPPAGTADPDHGRADRPRGPQAPTTAAPTALSPLPSLPFGNNDENEKDSADRRAGWKGI